MAETPGFDIRRIALLGGVGLVITVAMFIFLFRGCAARGPKASGYTVIYSNLDLRDAANVIARLKELAINYEIRDDGKAIAVPKEKADQARLGLAEKNLPMGGVVGWEIFDQARMGATDFDRRIQLIRAISGELSRTIRRIEGVEDARVQIVIPETKLFAATVAPVTASVMIRLKPGVELMMEKINGIVNLVASSVENLQTENVTVIDDTGKILSAKIAPLPQLPMALPPPPAETKVKIIAAEEAPMLTFEAMGEKMPLPEKAATSAEVAAASIEAMMIEATRTATLSAEEKILLKAQAKRDLERDLSGKAQELLNRFYPTNSVIVRVRVEIKPAKEIEIKASELKIKKLEAVVLIDNRVDLTKKLKEATYTTVAAAIGYDKKRGDKIIIQPVPFHLAAPIAPPPKPEVKKAVSLSFLWWGALFAGGVVILLLAIRIVKNWSGRRMTAAEELLPMESAPETPAAAPPREKGQTLERLRQQAENNPERIAELLKNWLTE